MSISGPLSFVLPEDVARSLGASAQSRRLASNLSRLTLASMSGVPATTIRKFETTGKISLVGLLQIADALGCLDNFSKVFQSETIITVDDVLAPKRKRGTR